MNEHEDKLPSRDELLDFIPKYLGMNITNFFGFVAGHLGVIDIETGDDRDRKKDDKTGGITSDALFKARKRRAMPYSYGAFCTALEKGMADYLGQVYPKEGAKAKTQEIVRQRWVTERRYIHCLIMAAYLVPGEELPFITALRKDYEPTKEKLLATFGTRFMEQDPRTAARLEHNFGAFASLSTNDCRFVAAMLSRKGEDRAEMGKWLRGITLPVGDVLKQLDPEELVCWKAIRDKADEDNDPTLTGGSWIAFRDRLNTLPLERAFSVCLFLEYTLPYPDGTEPFGPEEIDLFLIFKYYLTEEAQDELLEMWA